MPRSIALAELADLLRILAHPDRIRIVEELRNGEQDVGSLAEVLEAPSSRVSQHLAVLRAHRVVHRRRDGRRVLYHLDDPDLAAWLIAGLDYLHSGAKALQDAIAEARDQFAD